MKAILIVELDAAPSADNEQIQVRENGTRYWPAGSLLEGPRVFRLVQQGCAEPGDDACAERVNMTEQQFRDAVLSQKRVAAGIHPDDYDAYDAGQMVGYDEDGNHIPGPNAVDDDDDLISD